MTSTHPDSAETVVVIAAFNEASRLGEVVGGLRRAFPRVVVVDDGSQDATAEVAAAAGATVLRHVVNRGQGAALQTGLRWALEQNARWIVTFDADGQHRPEDIPALLAPLAEGRAEIVLGSRFLGSTVGMPALRRVMLKGAVLFTRLTSGLRITDAHNGLRAMSREAAAKIELRMDRMAHASELMDQIRRYGMAYCEVPVTIRYTSYSRAKGQRLAAAFRIVVDYALGRLFN